MTGLSSTQLLDAVPGLGFRQIDYWSAHGLFGAANMRLGSGCRRSFTEQDVQVAKVLHRVSSALTSSGGRTMGNLELYRQVAERVRRGDPIVSLCLGHGVFITVREEPA